MMFIVITNIKANKIKRTIVRVCLLSFDKHVVLGNKVSSNRVKSGALGEEKRERKGARERREGSAERREEGGGRKMISLRRDKRGANDRQHARMRRRKGRGTRTKKEAERGREKRREENREGTFQ